MRYYSHLLFSCSVMIARILLPAPLHIILERSSGTFDLPEKNETGISRTGKAGRVEIWDFSSDSRRRRQPQNALLFPLDSSSASNSRLHKLYHYEKAFFARKNTRNEERRLLPTRPKYTRMMPYMNPGLEYHAMNPSSITFSFLPDRERGRMLIFEGKKLQKPEIEEGISIYSFLFSLSPSIKAKKILHTASIH